MIATLIATLGTALTFQKPAVPQEYVIVAQELETVQDYLDIPEDEQLTTEDVEISYTTPTYGGVPCYSVYNTDTNTITIYANTDLTDDFEIGYVLAHECTHYLQSLRGQNLVRNYSKAIKNGSYYDMDTEVEANNNALNYVRLYKGYKN